MEKNNLERMLEDVQAKFALVLEGHDTLRHEILANRRELKDDISLLNVKIEALTQRIEAMERWLTKKIAAVEEDLQAHRADSQAHDKTVFILE